MEIENDRTKLLYACWEWKEKEKRNSNVGRCMEGKKWVVG